MTHVTGLQETSRVREGRALVGRAFFVWFFDSRRTRMCVRRSQRLAWFFGSRRTRMCVRRSQRLAWFLDSRRTRMCVRRSQRPCDGLISLTAIPRCARASARARHWLRVAILPGRSSRPSGSLMAMTLLSARLWSDGTQGRCRFRRMRFGDCRSDPGRLRDRQASKCRRGLQSRLQRSFLGYDA